MEKQVTGGIAELSIHRFLGCLLYTSSEKMKPFMANNSAIRAMFEEGKKMAAVYGAENVYDFSLGNPNVPVPEVNEAILEIVKEEAFNALHGYMSNAGFEDVRQTIAQSINCLLYTSRCV